MSVPVKAAIMGASGYGAGELLRLFTQHALVEIVSVTSTSRVGCRVGDVHSHLRGFYELTIGEAIDLERLFAGEHAVVFSSLPHGESAVRIGRLLEELGRDEWRERIKIIDLSGDLRIKDADVHARHYPKTPPLEDLRQEFVYGMSEINREAIGRARFVANPGCLATASILAGGPLIMNETRGTVVVDAKTGSSGSGRSLKDTTHHPTRHGNFRAYKPLAHQHEPEILQAWGDPRGERIDLSFVAQSMDVARGIFATVHVTMPDEVDADELRERYRSYYSDSPFVRVVDDSPALQDVVGSNFCDVGVACRGRKVIAMAAIDNLVKGMAGTAIQNMNLMCGLPETSGLWSPSFRPV